MSDFINSISAPKVLSPFVPFKEFPQPQIQTDVEGEEKFLYIDEDSLMGPKTKKKFVGVEEMVKVNVFLARSIDYAICARREGITYISSSTAPSTTPGGWKKDYETMDRALGFWLRDIPYKISTQDGTFVRTYLLDNSSSPGLQIRNEVLVGRKFCSMKFVVRGDNLLQESGEEIFIEGSPVDVENVGMCKSSPFLSHFDREISSRYITFTMQEKAEAVISGLCDMFCPHSGRFIVNLCSIVLLERLLVMFYDTNVSIFLGQTEGAGIKNTERMALAGLIAASVSLSFKWIFEDQVADVSPGSVCEVMRWSREVLIDSIEKERQLLKLCNWQLLFHYFADPKCIKMLD